MATEMKHFQVNKLSMTYQTYALGNKIEEVMQIDCVIPPPLWFDAGRWLIDIVKGWDSLIDERWDFVPGDETSEVYLLYIMYIR